MNNEEITQYYTTDEHGISHKIPKVNIDGLVELKTSQIVSRTAQKNIHPQSSAAIDGIPGIPFEPGISNPDTFFQGEDVIYDVFLFHDGKPVVKEDYDVLVSVKTSPRARNAIWSAALDMGIYPIPNKEGYYEIWIPSSVTETMLAGTYYLNVMIKERFGAGKGRFDRRYVLLKTYFNIDYSNFSEYVENRSLNARSSVEATWPNSPNTIGTRRNIQDNYYIDPT
jgi:hypothetical protein